ncbi:MAG: iron-sulfur cluster assembly protein, partial [Spirochaetes bacterium]|nr:iron-sulfur cluster assembly protein [Spirochaetota bacterium]
KERLKHVINPITGLDVQKGALVSNTEIKDGIITVALNLKEEHQFAGNLKEEIVEMLEPLWDVKKVKVTFLKS